MCKTINLVSADDVVLTHSRQFDTRTLHLRTHYCLAVLNDRVTRTPHHLQMWQIEVTFRGS